MFLLNKISPFLVSTPERAMTSCFVSSVINKDEARSSSLQEASLTFKHSFKSHKFNGILNTDSNRSKKCPVFLLICSELINRQRSRLL